MKIVKAMGLAILLGSLAACGGDNTGIHSVNTNPIAPVTPPVINPLDLGEVHWVVRDVNGLRALADQMEVTGQTNAVFYIIDQDSYNALAMNITEVHRYIKDQRAANDFLQATIITNNKPLDKPSK